MYKVLISPEKLNDQLKNWLAIAMLHYGKARGTKRDLATAVVWYAERYNGLKERFTSVLAELIELKPKQKEQIEKLNLAEDELEFLREHFSKKVNERSPGIFSRIGISKKSHS